MTVEGETANVAFLVLLCFFKALLELTLFLEAVLLSHLLLFIVGLHNAAIMTEVLQLAVEHLISAELTLQTAIIKRNLNAGFKADLLETLLTIG